MSLIKKSVHFVYFDKKMISNLRKNEDYLLIPQYSLRANIYNAFFVCSRFVSQIHEITDLNKAFMQNLIADYTMPTQRNTTR